MKWGYRFLLVLYCVFAVNTVLEYVWGDDGIEATEKLALYKDRLKENISELRLRNRELTAQLNSLRSDPVSVTLAARTLGYFQEGERVLRIEGMESGTAIYRMGTILEEPKAYQPVRSIVRLGACVLTALTTVLLTSKKEKT